MTTLTRTKRAAVMLIANAALYANETRERINHYKFTSDMLGSLGIRTLLEYEALQKDLNSMGWSMEAINMHEYALQKNTYLTSYVRLDSSRVDCLSDENLLDIVNSAAFRELCYNVRHISGWYCNCFDKETGCHFYYLPDYHVAVKLYDYDFMSSKVSIDILYGGDVDTTKDFVFFDYRQIATYVASRLTSDTGACIDDECRAAMNDLFNNFSSHSGVRICVNASKHVRNKNRYGVMQYDAATGDSAGTTAVLSPKVAFYEKHGDVRVPCYIVDIVADCRLLQTVLVRASDWEGTFNDLTGFVEYLVNNRKPS